MILRPTLAILVVAGLVAGCGAPTRPAGLRGPQPEAEALEGHLAALEQQIAELERGLGKGRGAYSQGSLLRVEGRGRGEPPLDRLRRLEREVADANAQLAARDARNAELSRELAAARDQGKALGEQAGDLSYARDALVTAQQALTEERGANDGLRAQLAASELQRLKAEREQYRFAAALLRIAPGQTTALLQLQDEARESARALDLRPAAAPRTAEHPAEPAAHPAAAAAGHEGH